MPLMLNDVKLAGNLTRDPEHRQVGETSVVNFGLAINRKYKSGDELKEEVTFVDVETWGHQAESCAQYLKKGRNVLIEGSLKLDQWEKDGVKRSKISVKAMRVHFIGSPENAGQGQQSSNTESPVAPSMPIGDEPPF